MSLLWTTEQFHNIDCQCVNVNVFTTQAGSLKLIINACAIDMIWISVFNPDLPFM